MEIILDIEKLFREGLKKSTSSPRVSAVPETLSARYRAQ